VNIAYLAAGKIIEYGRRQEDEDIGSLVILGYLEVVSAEIGHSG